MSEPTKTKIFEYGNDVELTELCKAFDRSGKAAKLEVIRLQEQAEDIARGNKREARTFWLKAQERLEELGLLKAYNDDKQHLSFQGRAIYIEDDKDGASSLIDMLSKMGAPSDLTDKLRDIAGDDKKKVTKQEEIVH